MRWDFFLVSEGRDFEEIFLGWKERKLWKVVFDVEYFMSRLGFEVSNVDKVGF